MHLLGKFEAGNGAGFGDLYRGKGKAIIKVSGEKKKKKQKKKFLLFFSVVSFGRKKWVF